MAKPKSRHAVRVAQPPAPVTVTRLAVTRCDRCGGEVAYRPEPGEAAQALTGHYASAHRDLAAV